MKQLILLFSILFTSALVKAQRSFTAEKQSMAAGLTYAKIASTVDTLGYAAYKNAAQALYKDQSGGFAVGTNFYQDLAKAQAYSLTSQMNVSKILFLFASKNKVAPDSLSYLLVNIYALDGLGTANGDSVKACPGTVLHSRKLLLDSIDTIAGNFTTVNFDWALTDDSIKNFAVGFDMSHLDTADRVGLYSTKDSSALKSQRSWEKQNNNKWYTMLKSWPLDIDFAIFPVVDSIFVGVNKLSKSTASTLSAAPNPCNEKVKINYSIAEPQGATLQIHNTSGELVLIQQLNTKNQGPVFIELDTKELKNGLYNLSILSGNSIQSKKLLIIH